MHEKVAFEAGELRLEQLQYWQPGQQILNRIRVDAGHGVGKTKLISGLINHFYDCFIPSIIYCFAPTWEQIHDLAFKEIKSDRAGKGLPGTIKDLELWRDDNHFVKGRATSNAGGTGTERVQGQHGKYLMFVLDEAEGIADFVYGAIDSMASGGICIVLMLANPRTRTSKFHKLKKHHNVASYRISCVWHPNVVQGRSLIPGAVERQYIEDMVAVHCVIVPQDEPDQHTFTLPFPVTLGEVVCPAGTIFRPDPEFMFRVLGIAPANVTDNTMVPVGRYEAARQRRTTGSNRWHARLGVDCARWGRDSGTLYVQHNGRLYRAAEFAQKDSLVYVRRIREEIVHLKASGVTHLHVRVDAGGGFGSTVVDLLRNDLELQRMFTEFKVIEVNFGGTPYDPAAYADTASEMYGLLAKSLLHLALGPVPDALEVDLCEREYRWVQARGKSVKRLEDKDAFKRRNHHSPDDGDGAPMAAAPEHLFPEARAWSPDDFKALSSGGRV